MITGKFWPGYCRIPVVCGGAYLCGGGPLGPGLGTDPLNLCAIYLCILDVTVITPCINFGLST